MTTIFLIRHGDVAGNSGAHRTFAGMRDLELTERGVRQATAVAERMANESLDVVYASTLQRAWRTADGIAARHNLTTVQAPGFCEVNYGEWEGLSEQDILDGYGELWKARVNDPENVAPPGGESYRMLFERLEPAWNRVLDKHAGQRIAIVGHNGSLRVLLCHLLGAPIANARRLLIGNCSVTKIVVENGEKPKTIPDGRLEGPPVVVEYINNTCHLEGI